MSAEWYERPSPRQLLCGLPTDSALNVYRGRLLQVFGTGKRVKLENLHQVIWPHMPEKELLSLHKDYIESVAEVLLQQGWLQEGGAGQPAGSGWTVGLGPAGPAGRSAESYAAEQLRADSAQELGRLSGDARPLV